MAAVEGDGTLVLRQAVRLVGLELAQGPIRLRQLQLAGQTHEALHVGLEVQRPLVVGVALAEELGVQLGTEARESEADGVGVVVFGSVQEGLEIVRGQTVAHGSPQFGRGAQNNSRGACFQALRFFHGLVIVRVAQADGGEFPEANVQTSLDLQQSVVSVSLGVAGGVVGVARAVNDGVDDGVAVLADEPVLVAPARGVGGVGHGHGQGGQLVQESLFQLHVLLAARSRRGMLGLVLDVNGDHFVLGVLGDGVRLAAVERGLETHVEEAGLDREVEVVADLVHEVGDAVVREFLPDGVVDRRVDQAAGDVGGQGLEDAEGGPHGDVLAVQQVLVGGLHAQADDVRVVVAVISQFRW